MSDTMPRGDSSLLKTAEEQCGRHPCFSYDVCCNPTVRPTYDLYSYDQWRQHNENMLKLSVRGHNQSNIVEYNVQRAINTLSASADQSQLNSTKQIQITARNIDVRRAYMYEILESVRNEINLMTSYKNRILKAQIAIKIICSISTECLERRSFRLNVDLTQDPAQEELVKEAELVNDIGNLLCQTLSQLDDQINRNKQVKFELEENWSDKNQSFLIDVLNLGLNTHSPLIMSHKNVLNDSESTCLTMQEWEKATICLHEKAENILNESMELRSTVEYQVLRNSAKQLRDQADAVDVTLARFISDSQQIQVSIENDLRQVVQRLGDSEHLIKDLLRIINNTEKAKKTAETRLYNRLKRPGNENCKDGAQLGLISEVNNLEENLNTLNYQLQCARTGYLGLQEARSKLEDEARIKRKTIWIDTIRCQKVRAHYPSINILIGH